MEKETGADAGVGAARAPSPPSRDEELSRSDSTSSTDDTATTEDTATTGDGSDDTSTERTVGDDPCPIPDFPAEFPESDSPDAPRIRQAAATLNDLQRPSGSLTSPQASSGGIDVRVSTPPNGESSERAYTAQFSSYGDLTACLRTPHVFGESFDVGLNRTDPQLPDHHRMEDRECTAPDGMKRLLRAQRWHAVSNIDSCSRDCCTFERSEHAAGELVLERACFEDVDADPPALRSLEFTRLPSQTTDPDRSLKRAAWRFLSTYFANPGDVSKDELLEATGDAGPVLLEINGRYLESRQPPEPVYSHEFDSAEQLAACRLDGDACDFPDEMSFATPGLRWKNVQSHVVGCRDGCCRIHFGHPAGPTIGLEGVCFDRNSEQKLELQCFQLEYSPV